MESHYRELMKGSLDLMILSLLASEAMYGYQIAKEVNIRSANLLHLREGSLYPALHRLEQADLVCSYWQPRPDGIERKYYRLTESGAQALQERRKTWQTFVQAVGGVVQHGTL